MNSEIKALYESTEYPAMSHPVSDPARTAVTARMAGLRTPHPASARILEIGCASGHNLLPLAMRWPQSHFVGIDLSDRAIREAKLRATEAGVANATFLAVDLMDFDADFGNFDYIIAHGVFSWVPDPAKQALLETCRRHLSPAGIAFISFNLASGWGPRMPVVERVRTLVREKNLGLTEAIEFLRQDDGAAETRPILDDLLSRGPEILPFDDFAPVNDPWPLEDFVNAAAAAGLRWLGESDPAENFPSSLGEAIQTTLKAFDEDPLKIQTAVDLLTERMFRSVILCRDDAPIARQLSTAIVFEFAIRHRPGASGASELCQALGNFAPLCVAVTQVANHLRTMDARVLARLVYQGILEGSILARIEPSIFNSEIPASPRLDRFRLLCARERLPLVDVWHLPCRFPASHHQVLELMDGSRSLSQLAAISSSKCPDLDLLPWLAHLTARGLFS